MGRRVFEMQPRAMHGRLTVIERGPNGPHGHARWWCKCTCGKRVLVAGSQLRSGKTKSCGCLRDEGRDPWAEDLTGKEHGRLTAIRMAPPKSRQAMCLCKCTCGNVCVVAAGCLRAGNTQSCGCLNREKSAERSTTHGMSGSPEYGVWTGMLTRCYNKNTESYPDYGGRGIRVCDQWMGREGFQTFIQDMGRRPSDSHSIERKKVYEDYGPTNCVWATPVEQARNKRNNLAMTMRGITKTIAEWSEETKIPYTTLRSRQRRGWEDARSLTTPYAAHKAQRKKIK